jgi:spoIIIJ-associated protein
MPEAPRIRVDVEFYRSMREDKMIARAKELAEKVRATGQSAELPPMNSYYRRLIHNVFVDDTEVTSISAGGDARFKRITLHRRQK